MPREAKWLSQGHQVSCRLRCRATPESRFSANARSRWAPCRFLLGETHLHKCLDNMVTNDHFGPQVCQAPVSLSWGGGQCSVQRAISTAMASPEQEPGGPAMHLFLQCFVSANVQSLRLTESHFHVVSLGNELFIAVYKVSRKPVWTIAELNKPIENWSWNNEAVWNTTKHKEYCSVKSWEWGTTPRFWLNIPLKYS